MSIESNKLIAEFMGWGEKNGFLFPPDDKSMHTIDGWDFKDIPFHTSWDWLMPVVQKCYKIDNEEGFDNLVDAVSTLDIDGTYEAVVEFIKNQKN